MLFLIDVSCWEKMIFPKSKITDSFWAIMKIWYNKYLWAKSLVIGMLKESFQNLSI
jgi:predicted metallopeptidase